MKSKLILLLLTFLSFHSLSQNTPLRHRVMFYNVENLFDAKDDTLKADEEFLPDGDRHWNAYKYDKKLKRISQVIFASGEGSLPILIGLAEVENHNVLEDLLNKTPLRNLEYRLVHQESPDRRGIDVALLYRKNLFQPLYYEAIPVQNETDTTFKTRDILYVIGTIGKDTLHVFINHWPSKYGGVVETVPLRKIAANTLKAKTNYLLTTNSNTLILIMGDFNDSPTDRSIASELEAQYKDTPQKGELVNMAYPLSIQGKGTNKYQGRWEVIDQMIVSDAFLQNKKGLYTSAEHFNIIENDFLLESDKTYLGKKPFRTFVGFKYNDGFSDHLPIVLDLIQP